MTEMVSGDLVDEPVDERPLRFLPPAQAQELTESIEEVLLFARARGLSSATVAARVVTFIAPLLVDKDLQIEQAGAALSTVVVAANRLAEVAGRRAEVAHRLRAELWRALPDAEAYRSLTPQSCPVGLHDGWLVDSEFEHACPWCLINERTEEVEQLRKQMAQSRVDGVS